MRASPLTDGAFLARLGARAASAAHAGAASFEVPELEPVARFIAGDSRVPTVRSHACDWLDAGGSYHDLVRLCATYVGALEGATPPAANGYVRKAAAELEPMLDLWPHVLVLPVVAALGTRDLIRLRPFPVHVLGVVGNTTWADGRPCSPAEYFFHDLDHARFKVREDLAALGIDIPDAYQQGDTLDRMTGQHRVILGAARAHVGSALWQAARQRTPLVHEVFDAIDSASDRTLAAAAELLAFEIVHEKSFPLDRHVLRRELATGTHVDKLRAKHARRFYGSRAPSAAAIAMLEAARIWLLDLL